MKNVTIKNKQGQIISDQNIYEDPTEFTNHIVSTNYWGKPERWVLAKQESGSVEEGNYICIYPDEQYDDADVLEQKQMEIDGEFVFHVKLKAEYTIEITDYVPPVPSSISPAQARLALLQAGFYDDVQNAVATSTDQVRIYWGYATSFERTNPILTSMASAIGITEEQLDDLFRLGITFK